MHQPRTTRLQAAFDGKHYLNAIPTTVAPPSGYFQLLRRQLLGQEERTPKQPLGPFVADAAALAAPVPADALRATWLGHSTVLLEVDGRRFLTDPVWSERASPTQMLGPKRFFAPPLALAQVAPLDAVLLSHDHYDHLDEAAIRRLAATGVPFYCPLGVGAHLRRWGVPTANITELNWWETASLGGGFKLVATPARHFSGRGLLTATTPSGPPGACWGRGTRCFSAATPALRPKASGKLAAAYGPFDLIMLEIGASDAEWADIHMGPDRGPGRPTGCWAAGRCCRCTGAPSTWRFMPGAPRYKSSWPKLAPMCRCCCLRPASA